ncbi:MAG: RHS repeat-associated core domain-containing protein [Aeriscardovia sp.]|nr:RHS repeat-associated core domain-containing protein [Aeriscardovia sp.]MBP3283556.1 RHS repeat-associated core domain-containing protein [Treponema sp.]
MFFYKNKSNFQYYTWNERNQLISSVDSSYSTAYVYGQDGQRSNKYTQNSETLYFNKMWTLHTDSGNTVYGGQTAKNIYLGETRIVTKLNGANDPTYQEEYYKQYFYHSDHLGSASLISDYNGDEYQRIEYTPYGETWVEKTSNTGMEYLPYKFTGKEMDEETGLYYYGARYLDPKYSMWISTDPALGEYIPIAPTNDEAKKHNSNLPGMGGVFNHINFNLYHYAGNSPVKYTDPDGKFAETAWDIFSLATGVASLVADVKAGNVKGAVIDSLGIVADAAAVALPCIPGGAGAAIKAARVTGAVANIAGGALSVQDGLENGDYVEAGLGALQFIVGGCGAGKKLSNITNIKVDKAGAELEKLSKSFSMDAQKLLGNSFSEIMENPTSRPIVSKLFEEMAKDPKNRSLLTEVNQLASKIIPMSNNTEATTVLKDIQDLTLKFGGN